MDNPAAPIPSIPSQPAVSSLPAETPNRHWVFWSAGGLTFLIFGIAIGVLSAKFFSQSQSPSQLTPTITPEPSVQSPTPTPASGPTANWKTYNEPVSNLSS